ncbi:hypothetical protein CerSpe_174720 [Prunus speciosa]
MTALKEERCEREPPVDDDDFGGLACPPLDDLEAVFILETMTCDPSNLFDDIKLEDDDFGGLPCPPLDDLEAVFILETLTCDPSNLFDDIILDERDLAILETPKKPSHGEGKDLETLRLMLSAPPPSSCQQNPKGPEQSDPHHNPQDWDDEEKLETSVRKLHQGYQEFQNKGNKIEVIDIKNLPLPSNQGTFLTSSGKCRAF